MMLCKLSIKNIKKSMKEIQKDENFLQAKRLSPKGACSAAPLVRRSGRKWIAVRRGVEDARPLQYGMPPSAAYHNSSLFTLHPSLQKKMSALRALT